jgi:lipooligosaccharide transport system ATP-binding protein
VAADVPDFIVARGLTKRFGAFVAVDGIDFEVARGEAFGFLGPNGAGKSSTMRMIGGVSPVTAGELRVLGLDPAQHGPAIRARLGVVPQEDTLDLELSVVDNLVIYGRYFDLPRREARRRAEELLDFVQLTDRASSRVDDLSGGMKRRLTIARALINEPDILLLDEPTTGLDPQARHVVWDRLYRLKQRGVTIVLTTHYMDEAQTLADRVAVIAGGIIVAEGTPATLGGRDTSSARIRFRTPVGVPLSDLPVPVRADDNGMVSIETSDEVRVLHVLTGWALEHGHTLEALAVERPSLEDVYLKLTAETAPEPTGDIAQSRPSP